MQRFVLISCFCVLASCQLPGEKPAVTAEPKPAETSSEPDPLPPEETPSPESTEPAPAPVAQPVEPGVAPTGTPTRGKLPKGVVDEKLKSAAPAIQACYERALKATPDLHGTVNINFVVAPDGKVAHVEAADVDDALTHPATVDCILGVIKKLEFPAPSGGRVFLNYPLKLEPPKPAP